MRLIFIFAGVYNITIDGEEGTMKVTGKINPNTLLSVLEKYEKHAKVKYVKLDGEVVERNTNYEGEYEYNHNRYDNMKHCSYPPHFSCTQHQGYQHYPYFPPPPNSYQFAPPPPPSRPFWGAAPPPPPPPCPYGYEPPSMTSFCSPHHFPTKESPRQNKPNKCAIM